jgi:hypothetical protein
MYLPPGGAARQKGTTLSSITARERISTPFMVLVEMLLSDHPGWLESFLRIAASEGERAAISTYGADAGLKPAAQKGARVALGESLSTDAGGLRVPISWRVQGYRALPGFFEGVLTLEPAGPESTDLVLAGSWPGDPDVSNSTRDASSIAARTCVERLLATLRIAVEEAATVRRA